MERDLLLYGIIKKLQLLKKSSIINILQNGVNVNERRKGKKHQVFKLSFFVPLRVSEGTLRTTTIDALYKHSGASFYEPRPIW